MENQTSIIEQFFLYLEEQSFYVHIFIRCFPGFHLDRGYLCVKAGRREIIEEVRKKTANWKNQLITEGLMFYFITLFNQNFQLAYRVKKVFSQIIVLLKTF